MGIEFASGSGGWWMMMHFKVEEVEVASHTR